MSARRARLGALIVLALGVLVGWRWWILHAARPRILVRGGDGGGLPLATPADEHLDALALERLPAAPAAGGLQVLIVMRHGHIVFARYHGLSADSRVDTGMFARVLAALAGGIAVQTGTLAPLALVPFDPSRVRDALEAATHTPYAQYLSRRLWSRLNAADAWIEVPRAGATTPADCCFQARVQDWLRIGQLLVNDGNFEGTQVLATGWIARMRLPQSSDTTQGMGLVLTPARPGAPVYESNDVCLLRGPGHWRLWAVPSLQLVVLFGAPGPAAPDGWDEAQLPNLVMEALTDRPPAQQAQTPLQLLVPGH